MSLEHSRYGRTFGEFQFDDLGIGQVIDVGAPDSREPTPRRYYVNEQGRPVLIGLSIEETLEFEKLERLPPVDENGQVAWSPEGYPTTIREKRWRELYVKHDNAWTMWAAENIGQK